MCVVSPPLCPPGVPESPQIYAYSERGEKPAFCTVFNHLVKSGGTTVKDQLIRAAKDENQDFPGWFTAQSRRCSAACAFWVAASSAAQGLCLVETIPCTVQGLAYMMVGWGVLLSARRLRAVESAEGACVSLIGWCWVNHAMIGIGVLS